MNTCECSRCLDSLDPCHFDCELDDLCPGCEAARQDAEDIRAEIDFERGVR